MPQQKNAWSDATEESVKDLGTEANIYSLLHKKSAGVLNAKMAKTTLIASILSAITASAGAGSVITQLSEDIAWISIGISIGVSLLSLATTIILIYQRTGDFLEKTRKHRESEAQYMWVASKIQGQLQLPVGQREPGNIFYNWIAHIMGTISTAEDIEVEAMEAFLKSHPGQSVPGLDKVRQIRVEEGSESSDANKSPSESKPIPRASISNINTSSPKQFKSSLLGLRETASYMSPVIYQSRNSPLRRFIDDENSRRREIELISLHEKNRTRGEVEDANEYSDADADEQEQLMEKKSNTRSKAHKKHNTDDIFDQDMSSLNSAELNV